MGLPRDIKTKRPCYRNLVPRKAVLKSKSKSKPKPKPKSEPKPQSALTDDAKDLTHQRTLDNQHGESQSRLVAPPAFSPYDASDSTVNSTIIIVLPQEPQDHQHQFTHLKQSRLPAETIQQCQDLISQLQSARQYSSLVSYPFNGGHITVNWYL